MSEAPAGSSGQAASRFGNEEDKKEDDTEDEEKEEEEVGGIGPRFNLGMALKVVRDLFEKATSAASVLPPDNLPDAVRDHITYEVYSYLYTCIR